MEWSGREKEMEPRKNYSYLSPDSLARRGITIISVCFIQQPKSQVYFWPIETNSRATRSDNEEYLWNA